MKVIKEAPWLCVLEEGDTPEDMAKWIENNVSADQYGVVYYSPGDVDYRVWPVTPVAGDVIVFNAPGKHTTTRFPGWVKSVPSLSQRDREDIEKRVTGGWKVNYLRLFVNIIVYDFLRLDRIFRRKQRKQKVSK